MNLEDRKEYNKKYYEANKNIILAKACVKVQCEICKRKVIKNNLGKHYNLPICRRKQEQSELINSRLNPI